MELYSETKEVCYVTSNYADWKKDLRAWQEAFFTLLSYKNSWGGFYKLTIESNYDGSPYLYIVFDSKRINYEVMLDWLNDLGYGNTKFGRTNARILDATWLSEADDEFDETIGYYFVEE